jgi:hypothetical protein
VPQELRDPANPRLANKEKEILETAVSAAIHLHADASPTRVALLAKTMLLIFLHDGE